MITITANQIVAHLVGDFMFQSDWMATNKKSYTIPCLAHCIVYTLIFVLFFKPSIIAIFFIFFTHFIMDRFGLARYLVWIKNFLNPTFKFYPWSVCKSTGNNDMIDMPNARPIWLTVWLTIIVDNTIHLISNGIALTCL